jgi:hypothetical protein
MPRHVAKIASLAIASLAGWGVRLEVAEVFEDPSWLSFAAGAAVLVLVFPIAYFLFLRPVVDMIEDRLSAARLRIRATRAGTGLDAIPPTRKDDTLTRIVICGYCGGPGGPVCDKCHEKLAAR